TRSPGSSSGTCAVVTAVPPTARPPRSHAGDGPGPPWRARTVSGQVLPYRIFRMRSWPAPQVPLLSDQGLPGPGPALQLYDTASGTVRPTAPGPTARMYVCGI